MCLTSLVWQREFSLQLVLASQMHSKHSVDMVVADELLALALVAGGLLTAFAVAPSVGLDCGLGCASSSTDGARVGRNRLIGCRVGRSSSSSGGVAVRLLRPPPAPLVASVRGRVLVLVVVEAAEKTPSRGLAGTLGSAGSTGGRGGWGADTDTVAGRLFVGLKVARNGSGCQTSDAADEAPTLGGGVVSVDELVSSISLARFGNELEKGLNLNEVVGESSADPAAAVSLFRQVRGRLQQVAGVGLNRLYLRIVTRTSWRRRRRRLRASLVAVLLRTLHLLKIRLLFAFLRKRLFVFCRWAELVVWLLNCLFIAANCCFCSSLTQLLVLRLVRINLFRSFLSTASLVAPVCGASAAQVQAATGVAHIVVVSGGEEGFFLFKRRKYLTRERERDARGTRDMMRRAAHAPRTT